MWAYRSDSGTRFLDVSCNVRGIVFGVGQEPLDRLLIIIMFLALDDDLQLRAQQRLTTKMASTHLFTAKNKLITT